MREAGGSGLPWRDGKLRSCNPGSMTMAAARKSRGNPVTVHPATPERWPDVERLFGANGACGGCWCQFFKQTASEYASGCGDPNKRRMKRSVASGTVPGLIAYDGDEPVGWCAVEPKERFARLSRARILRDVDDAPAWAVPCFFVKRSHRGRGITVALLKAARAHAKAHGATLLEGYPVAPGGRMGDTFAYHGTLSAFEQAGFDVIATPSKARRVVRRRLTGRRP